MMPVQAMVSIFGFSMLPQVTRTGGSGPKRVLPFQLCFAIYKTASSGQGVYYIIGKGLNTLLDSGQLYRRSRVVCRFQHTEIRGEEKGFVHIKGGDKLLRHYIAARIARYHYTEKRLIIEPDSSEKGGEAVDAGGDIFGGSAVWKLLQSDTRPEDLNDAQLRDITAFACTAAGLSTTKSGGISSVPEYESVLKLLPR